MILNIMDVCILENKLYIKQAQTIWVVWNKIYG